MKYNKNNLKVDKIMNDNSSLLDMNITNKEIEALKYKKIKILRKLRFNNNINIPNLNLSNKFQKRRMVNEKYLFKTKLKSNSFFTNFYDYSYPSLKNDFSSSEKIIQKAKEFRNTSYNSILKEKEKNESTFLTENKSWNNKKILPVINFNQNLNHFLRNNSLFTYPNKSVTNLKQKSRIQWKFNYINNLCKNIINSHVNFDFFEKLQKYMKKSESIYNKYKFDIKNYLYFLDNVKLKEEDFIFILKSKKKKIIKSIKHLNEKIIKYKEIRNQCLDIKNFLLTVKGENSNDDLTLSPIKEIRNELYITHNNEIRKSPKISQNKFILESNNVKNNINYTSRNLQTLNQKIFSTPDEFLNLYEEKLIKIRNKIIYYNKAIEKVIILKKDKEKYLINKPAPIEKIDFNKYYSMVDLLKSTNTELLNKLNVYNNFKQIKNKGFKILEIKLRNIILKINSLIDLNQKCFTDFKSIYEVLDLNEQGKNKNLHLLKLLEKITDLVLEEDRKYKQEPHLKYLYSKIKLANEQVKFGLNRKKQIYKINKKELEKNKKILEHHRKTRIIPFNKNGINLKYYHKINKLNISSKMKDELINREIKKKNEEISNLICYN